MAEETKLARTAGMMLTTVEASSLASGGGEIMTRIVDDGPSQTLEPGHGTDLGVRANLAAMMKARPFRTTLADLGLHATMIDGYCKWVTTWVEGGIFSKTLRNEMHPRMMQAAGVLDAAPAAIAQPRQSGRGAVRLPLRIDLRSPGQ